MVVAHIDRSHVELTLVDGTDGNTSRDNGCLRHQIHLLRPRSDLTITTYPPPAGDRWHRLAEPQSQ